MRIALVNETDRSEITDAVVDRMVAALNVQGEHFAAMWQRAPIEVIRVDQLDAVDVNDCPIGLFLNADAPGILGYHSISALGRPVGRAFWGPVMSHGGDPIAGADAFSVTVSHEYLETCGDPYANAWAQTPDGEFEAIELCDRVEGDGYEVDGSGVWVSNFLGPRAFNQAEGAVGPFDWMRKLRSGWDMTPGGYRIRMDRTMTVRNDFADRSLWSSEKIASKRSELARSFRRGCVFA